jgi:hypothetical protein
MLDWGTRNVKNKDAEKDGQPAARRNIENAGAIQWGETGSDQSDKSVASGMVG